MPGATAEADPATSAVVSDDLAARLHLAAGSQILLRGRDHTETFKVQSVAKGQNAGWIGIDIAAAQQLLNMYGRLDRIEVVLGPTQDEAEANRLIRAAVPATWTSSTPGARSEENRRMLRAFRWNLRILSYISLLVGAFLIYNTISVSVVRRRTEIGILRALGVSARGVLLVFLGEAAMLGLVGSVLGIVLGRVLAAGLRRNDLGHRERALHHQRAQPIGPFAGVYRRGPLRRGLRRGVVCLHTGPRSCAGAASRGDAPRGH